MSDTVQQPQDAPLSDTAPDFWQAVSEERPQELKAMDDELDFQQVIKKVGNDLRVSIRRE